MTRKRWALAVVVVVVIAVAVTGGVLRWLNPPPPSPPPGYVSLEGAMYFPGCDSKTLNLGGKTWYLVARNGPPQPRRNALPNPGGGLGTLYVYSDGTAYWISLGGYIAAWFTLTPQTYDWVC